MLHLDSINTAYNATSVIDDEDAAVFNANFTTPRNSLYINISIENLAMVKNNLDTIKTDLISFIDYLTEEK